MTAGIPIIDLRYYRLAQKKSVMNISMRADLYYGEILNAFVPL